MNFLSPEWLDGKDWPRHKLFFGSSLDFEEHQMNQANLEQNSFRCLSCGKNFTLMHNLRRHQLKCGDKEPNFNCQICEKKFFRSDCLRIHQRTIHNVYERERRRLH